MDYRHKSLLLVIFGITGDLAQRKLLPALYNLLKRNELPDEFRVVGISRQDTTVSNVYAPVKERLKEVGFDESIFEELESRTEMFKMAVENESDYHKLHEKLHLLSHEIGPGVSRIYYLSIPGQAFMQVVQNLGLSGHQHAFSDDIDQPKLLVEKPFGYNIDSAKSLVEVADKNFGESQTYRIDHYLAKETAQNILTFRLHNPLFKSIWNSRHIQSIYISSHETIGIENRVAFYEQTGALRDVLQSHLLQLLTLITMELPGSMESQAIHQAKENLFSQIKTITPSQVKYKAQRGQYSNYREEVSNPNSNTETFAKIQLDIESKRWDGVEITLETGKALSEKLTQICVQFRETESSSGVNSLIFRLQPKEGITLLLQAKQPGLFDVTEQVEMNFDYAKSFGGAGEAYERVIVDAIRSDQSLFSSSKEVLESWRIIGNVLDQWQGSAEGLKLYEIGADAKNIK